MAKSQLNINGAVSPEQFDRVVSDCAFQQRLDPKYKLPTFDCPVCGAKKILFAGDKVAKNETVLEMLREGCRADYVIICPKCKSYIAVRRYAGKQALPVRFRCDGRAFAYATVYNHGIRGVYRKRPEYEPVFPGEYLADETQAPKRIRAIFVICSAT